MSASASRNARWRCRRSRREMARLRFAESASLEPDLLLAARDPLMHVERERHAVRIAAEGECTERVEALRLVDLETTRTSRGGINHRVEFAPLDWSHHLRELKRRLEVAVESLISGQLARHSSLPGRRSHCGVGRIRASRAATVSETTRRSSSRVTSRRPRRYVPHQAVAGIHALFGHVRLSL
jgi:hypothetical protein